MTIIDFEGIASVGRYREIPDGQFGLNWDNFYAVHRDAGRGTGYENVINSGEASGFNGFADPAAFNSTGQDFDLDSGYFAAAFNNRLNVTVTAFDDGVEVAQQTFVIDQSKTFITFDAEFDSIDRVLIESSGNGSLSHVAMDDLLVMFEKLLGTAGDDFIHRAGDSLTPPAGYNDIAASTAGADDIEAGGGADIVFAAGGDDTVAGGGAGDLLYGGRGNDTLFGGSGSDRLAGNKGVDELWGGAGRDAFAFSASASPVGGSDTIRDFDAMDGDRIILRAIDADTRLAGDQAFTFIGGASFGGTAGELRYSSGLAQGDVDGDGAADIEFRLAGGPSLVAADFVL